MEEHWEALVAVAVTNASCKAIEAIQAQIAGLEEKLKRTEQALSISHRTTDNYRKALEQIADREDNEPTTWVADRALNPDK